MSDQENSEMQGFPGRIIKFGSFNVTSQVQTEPIPTREEPERKLKTQPLLPGHILVSPQRVAPRLADLSKDEISDLFLTVTRIQHTLKRLYKADAFNVAVQDGEAAGQTVPHVHCHVIPRTKGDPGGDDKVHEWLEGEEGNVGAHQKQARDGASRDWPKDEERKPRTKEEMEGEAKWLREELDKDMAEDGSVKL